MGISKMQGSPWHIEKIHHEKRDLLRCKYYDPFEKYCLYRCKKCVGTYYCMYYYPLKDKEYTEKLAEIKKKKKQKASINKSSSVVKTNNKTDGNKKKATKSGSQIKTIKQTNNPPKIIFAEGTIVVHAGYGEGKVINQEGDTIEIEYGGGIGKRKQKLSSLISNNLLTKKCSF